jgi:hypothetical protein
MRCPSLPASLSLPRVPSTFTSMPAASQLATPPHTTACSMTNMHAYSTGVMPSATWGRHQIQPKSQTMATDLSTRQSVKKVEPPAIKIGRCRDAYVGVVFWCWDGMSVIACRSRTTTFLAHLHPCLHSIATDNQAHTAACGTTNMHADNTVQQQHQASTGKQIKYNQR